MVLKEDPTNPLSYVEVVLGFIILCVTWIAICVRFLVRHRMRILGPDDILALVSEIFFTLCFASLLRLLHFVPGAEAPSLHADELYMTWLIVCAIMYGWSMIFLKLSLGTFFLRILMSQRQRYVVYVVMVLSVTINVLDTFWNIFSCGNPRLYFAHRLSGECASNGWGIAESYIQAVANTGTDITLACMPFFLLRGSTMPMSSKLSVGFILILATTSCAAGLVGFVYIPEYYQETNFFRSINKVFIIREVEVGTGILAGSLATMRPLLSFIITRIKFLDGIPNRFSRKPVWSLNTFRSSKDNEFTIRPTPKRRVFPFRLATVAGDIDSLPISDERKEAKVADMVEVTIRKDMTPVILK